MTLEEYAVERMRSLEVDNSFLKNQLENVNTEINALSDAYFELKNFLKKHVVKCTAAEGYKMDKYFWESDPEYDFVSNLVEEDKPF